jgi:hypothetical protein
MRLPTASELPRVMMCNASAVIPRADFTTKHADRGTAIHAFLHGVRKMGRIKALELVPAEHREFCASIDVTALPIDGEPEVTYAWDYTCDTGRVLGHSLGRDYSKAAPTEFVGTADLVEVAGGIVRVWDYKTGFYSVEPDTWQLRMLGLAAARAHGVDEAEVGIAKVRDDGKVVPVTVRLSAMQLDGDALALEMLAGKLAKLQGVPAPALNVLEGDHCRYCPGKPRCPAKTALIQALPVAVSAKPSAEMTLEQAGKAWDFIQRARKVLDDMEEKIGELAEDQPIPLPDGRVLKVVEKSRESIDATVAWGVIARDYSTDLATKAVEQKATKASIKRALGKDAPAALKAIEREGGIAEKVYTAVEPVGKAS